MVAAIPITITPFIHFGGSPQERYRIRCEGIPADKTNYAANYEKLTTIFCVQSQTEMPIVNTRKPAVNATILPFSRRVIARTGVILRIVADRDRCLSRKILCKRL